MLTSTAPPVPLTYMLQIPLTMCAKELEVRPTASLLSLLSTLIISDLIANANQSHMCLRP